MKKILIALFMCLMMIGCGDDVTNINGYTEEQVQAKIDSTLAAQDVIIINDTVYQMTVDTIYNMVIDTVMTELVDTIYQRVVDTVTNELVDTIYHRVIDTVYKELVDTIYERVIDTVFTVLETMGVNTELPRDTTITLYDTLENKVIATTYTGVVYKKTFYSNEIKSFATDEWVSGYSNLITLNDNHCVDEFRLFNETDAYKMAQYLNMLVDEETLIYLSTVDVERLYGAIGNITINAAKYMVPNLTKKFVHRAGDSKSKPLELNAYYMCAYDL